MSQLIDQNFIKIADEGASVPYFINDFRMEFPLSFFDEWMLIDEQSWNLAKESMNSTDAITGSGKIKVIHTIETVPFIAYWELQCLRLYFLFIVNAFKF